MKKRILAMILTIALLMGILPTGVWAADTVASGSCGENVTWVLDSDGVLTISGTGAMDNYSSYAPWYDQRSSITSVVIETGVTSIGNYAFYKCSSLTSISIPDGVTSIGGSAFRACSSLPSITIPDGVTSIGEYAFYDCSSLTGINIPDGVTSIESSVFRGCSSLTSVTIPDGVTSIGEYAFYDCSSLTDISIPDSVTDIWCYAFRGCSSLTSITIPDGITRIENGAFKDCSSLTSVTIPDSVTSIGEYAFYNCSSLTGINIPDGVTSIGKYTFYKCSSLTSITIPDSVTSIGEYAFYNCSSLTGINIPDGVTSIGNYTFYNCSSLTSITIPDGVTSIGKYTFYKCSSLTSITIPDGVTSIGELAFERCSSLTSISIPDSVTSIGKEAFAWCDSLTSVTIPDGVTSIGFETFYFCSSLTSISIPDSVTSIDSFAFSSCSSLTSISIPDSVTSIANNAFSSCSSLTSITVSDGVTSIASSTFAYCSSLISITIPDGVTSIGEYAFYDCRSLTDVYYGGSQTAWGKISIGGNNSALTKANIHYNSFFAGSKMGSLASNIPSDQYGIFVVDSDGNPIQGAKVLWSYTSLKDGLIEKEAYTDDNGLVTFPKYTDGEPLIQVSCDEYLTYTNEDSNYSKSADGYEVIKLYRQTESSLKLKQAKYNDTVDLLTKTKKINLKNTGNLVGDLTDGAFTIVCKAIDVSEVQEYQLWQGDTQIATTTDGTFSLNVEDGFSSGGNCFVRVIAKDGREVDTRINLTFTSNTINEATGIKLGKSATFTIRDENIPFLGGSTFDIGGLSDLLPVEMEVTEEKLYIGFNADIWTPDGDKKEIFEGFKEDLAKTIKLGKAFTKQNIKSIKSLVKNDSDFSLPGGDVKVNVIGYAEGNLGSSTATGEIYLICSATTPTYGFTAWVVVVPVTVQINGTLDVQVGAKISYNWETATLIGEVPLEVAVALEAFGGAGVGKVVGVGAYGTAKLDIGMKLFSEQFLESLDLTGEMGLKAYVGPFTYSRPFAYNTWHLYTANTVSAQTLTDDMTSESEEITNQHAYELVDLSYLHDESEWLGENGGIMLLSLDETVNELTALQTGTYRNMQPVIGSANGLPVMVWTKADTTRETMDATQLVYSVYSDGVWSEPQAVDPDNTTADGTASLTAGADGTLCVTYQSAETTLASDSTLSDYAAVQQIVVAEFDAENRVFQNHVVLSSSGVYNRTPRITEVNGAPTVLWVANADTSDIFGQNNTNEIVYAQYIDGQWTGPEVLVSGQNAVVDVQIGSMNGDVCAAVITDEDNDLSTTEDHDLVVYPGLTQSGSLLETGSISTAQFAQLPGAENTELVWADSEALYRYDGVSTEVVLTAEYLSDGFTVLTDRILWNAAAETGSDLYAIIYEDGWQAPVQITDQSDYLQSYSATEIDGITYLAAVQTAVTITEDEIVDDCTLSWAKLDGFVDLAINGLFADDAVASSGEDFELSVDVVNNGDSTADAYTITVYSNETEIASETVNNALPSGGTATTVITLPALDATAYGTTYRVVVHNANDVISENDSAEIVVGYTDLTVDANLLQIGDRYQAMVKVENNSIIPSGGTLHVWCEGNEIGDIVVDELAQGEWAVVEVMIDSEMLDCVNSGTLSIEITSELDEWNELNNTSEVVIAATGHTLEKTEAKAATCTEDGNSEYYTCTTCGTFFSDEDGTVEIEEDSWLIPATGHTWSEEWTSDETGHWHACTVCGAESDHEDHVSSGEATETDAEICTVCGYVITPALGHIHTNLTLVEAKAATCTEAGNKEYYICDCGTWFEDADALVEITDHSSVEIPATGHTLEKTEARAATCTEDGNSEYWTCSECGKLFADENGTIETTAEDVKIAATGHSYSDEWSCDETYHWHICTVCGEESEHEDHVSSGAATEDTAEICTVCGYVITPALGHIHTNLTLVEAKAATCTEAGNKEYYICDCGTWFEDADALVEITDHSSVEIPATGHTLEKTEAKAATCTEDGNTEYWTCSECGKLFADENGTIETTAEDVKIAATGHSYSDEWSYDETGHWHACTVCGAESEHEDHVSSGAATEDADEFCTVCGYVITPALGHDPEATLQIIRQPVDVSGAVNEELAISLEAQGEGLTYQWYYSSDGVTFTKSGTPGYDTDTLRPVLRAYRDGYKYYCVVTDSNGNTVRSNTVTMTVESSDVTITQQPADITDGVLNQLHTFHVEAEGTNLAYRWYWSDDDGETWTESYNDGYDTDTLTVRLYAYRSGYLYKCIVTSGLKVSLESDAVLLKLQEQSAEIAKQPESVTAAVGETATFTVEASGTNLTYLWYYSTDGTEWTQTWLDGYDTDTLSFSVTATRAAKYYRCVVTDGSGYSVTSGKAALVTAAPAITTEPEAQTVAAGDTVAFTVEASGTNLTYLWYYSTDGTTWTQTWLDGYNTDTLSFEVTANRASKYYRCIVTDMAGNTAESTPAYLTLG